MSDFPLMTSCGFMFCLLECWRIFAANSIQDWRLAMNEAQSTDNKDAQAELVYQYAPLAIMDFLYLVWIVACLFNERFRVVGVVILSYAILTMFAKYLRESKNAKIIDSLTCIGLILWSIFK